MSPNYCSLLLSPLCLSVPSQLILLISINIMSEQHNIFDLMQSDPMAVLYVKNRFGIEEEIGRTEVIMNSLDPIWIAKFNVNYQFETVQQLV